MSKQGPDFHFEISGYRDKQSLNNESLLYIIIQLKICTYLIGIVFPKKDPGKNELWKQCRPLSALQKVASDHFLHCRVISNLKRETSVY